MHVSNGALFAISTLIWGSTWLAITFQLGVVAPEISVAYRFALASAILAAWCLATRRSLRFSRREHPVLAAFGATLFGLNYVGVYWAERFVASGLVAVVFSTIVFMTPIGMRLAFGERLTLRLLVRGDLGRDRCRALVPARARRGAARRRRGARHRARASAATAIATVGNLIAVRNHKAGLPTFPATAWGMAYGALTPRSPRRHRRAVDVRSAPQATCCRSSISRCSAASFAFGAYLDAAEARRRRPVLRSSAWQRRCLRSLLSTLFEGYRWTWVGARRRGARGGRQLAGATLARPAKRVSPRPA